MLDGPSYLYDVFLFTETTIGGALKILLLLTIDAVMISILFISVTQYYQEIIPTALNLCTEMVL